MQSRAEGIKLNAKDTKYPRLKDMVSPFEFKK